MTLVTSVPKESFKEKAINGAFDLSTIGLAVLGGPEGALTAQGAKVPTLKAVEEVKTASKIGRSGKQARLKELGNEPINMADINKKIENILKMAENERYDYFVRKVADFEQVWGLSDNGWALLGDDKGNQILPLWPEREFAELCAIDQWKGYKPEAIELDNFLEKWIPGMTNDKTLVNIFLTPNAKGTIISPNNLNSDIQEELEEYE